jgi:hypothetical protein
MLFLNILIRDLILFYSEIKLNYKKNIVFLVFYFGLNTMYQINYPVLYSVLFFFVFFIPMVKKNIAIDHYNRLKFALIRYEMVYLYQVLSYIIIFIMILLVFFISA